MSPASYRTAPPRVAPRRLPGGRRAAKSSSGDLDVDLVRVERDVAGDLGDGVVGLLVGPAHVGDVARGQVARVALEGAVGRGVAGGELVGDEVLARHVV